MLCIPGECGMRKVSYRSEAAGDSLVLLQAFPAYYTADEGSGTHILTTSDPLGNTEVATEIQLSMGSI